MTEEKKAIEEIKKFKFTESEKVAEENGLEHAEFARFLTIYHRKQLNILLNLIEKLQKENEELKKPKDNIQVVYSGRNYGKTNSILKEYISKDKIREVLNKDKDYICADRITQDIKKLLEEG